MKKILIATDFSTPAHNAARYAWHLAAAVKANVELFNAFKIPAYATMAAHVAWPLQDYQALKAETLADLKLLADKLAVENEYAVTPGAFKPTINCANEVGGLAEVITDEVASEKVCLVVMGMSDAGTLSRLFLGSNRHDVINEASFPLLLIPPQGHFNGIKKIALATDLSESDIPVIQSVASLAKHFNAEVLLVHIVDKPYQESLEKKVKSFINTVVCKVNYDKIYYRPIESQSVDHGLDWLTEHGQIDMLSIIHRKHSWLEKLFDDSYTQKIARHIRVPLLVFPDFPNHANSVVL